MISRRTVLAGLAGAALARASARLHAAPSKRPPPLRALTDEISQDFGHACEVASRDFGMGLVDLREAGGKNLMNWDAAQVADVRKVLERFKLRVACLATPIFKVDWPDAPKSPFSPTRDEFGASFTFAQQDELLERAFELARKFKTDRIRIFDFWRLEDQKPHRAAIDEVVRKAAAKAAKRGLTLVLENEYACNTATGAEAGRLLAAIPDKALQITWDPGNAQFRDEVPFPAATRRSPRDASATCTARTRCAPRTARNGSGWRWGAASSTGPASSARSRTTDTASRARSRRTGAAPARRKRPAARASPG